MLLLGSHLSIAGGVDRALTAAWNAQIVPMGIDAGELLPNAGGLAGAQSVTYADLGTVMSHVAALDGAVGSAAHLTVWMPFPGVNATFGN